MFSFQLKKSKFTINFYNLLLRWKRKRNYSGSVIINLGRRRQFLIKAKILLKIWIKMKIKIWVVASIFTYYWPIHLHFSKSKSTSTSTPNVDSQTKNSHHFFVDLSGTSLSLFIYIYIRFQGLTRRNLAPFTYTRFRVRY